MAPITAIIIAVVAIVAAGIILSGGINDDSKSTESIPTNKQLEETGESSTGSPLFQQLSNMREGYESISPKERAILPDCKEGMLTVAPTNMENIVSIEPRGSTTPPEHTLASSSTDTYLAVDTRETTKTVPLYAPGDIWIFFIQPRTGVTADPEDDVIYYAMCKDVFGVFDHVKDLSAEVRKIVDEYNCPYGGNPGDSKCPVQVFEPVKAGTHLGVIGRLQGNANFGTWDLRHTNYFVNPDRYGTRSLHSTCPLDYYSEPLRSQLTQYLDRSDKSCGTVEYDVAGTLQGEWFYGDATNFMGPSDWPNQLFLGYSNRLPEVGVVSIGGVVSEPLKWMFNPTNSGMTNVDFNLVRDDRVYCYESDGNYKVYEKGPSGKVLIKLANPQELQIEYREGSCSTQESLNNPVTYSR